MPLEMHIKTKEQIKRPLLILLFTKIKAFPIIALEAEKNKL